MVIEPWVKCNKQVCVEIEVSSTNDCIHCSFLRLWYVEDIMRHHKTLDCSLSRMTAAILAIVALDSSVESGIWKVRGGT